jgi:hypothetical protein
MRFANLMFATVILSAVAGAAMAKNAEPAGLRSAPPRIETISLSKTWLWQPSMRRVAAAH